MGEVTTMNPRTMQRSTGGDTPTTGDDSMEARVAKLEAILPTLATKADVADVRGELRAAIAESKSSIITWGSTLIVGAAVATITILAILINRISPPTPATPAPQVIVVPMPAAPATPATPPK